MSIFSRCALTRLGRNLIAKTETKKTHIAFTRAVVGDGIWSASEDIGEAEALKNGRLEYTFSDIETEDSNPANVQLTVVIHNVGLTSLVYVMEMGIYATDPDLGEILYAVLAADEKYIYLPAENGVGLSQITERINLEVFNAPTVTVETAGALVSAADFKVFRAAVTAVTEALKGGDAGQLLIKKADVDYAFEWVDKNIVTKPYAQFPKIGQADALYIDSESTEFYIWTELSDGTEGYFKLPVGSEASTTLQTQITANSKNIAANTKSIATQGTQIAELQDKYSEVTVTVPVSGWKSSTSGGVTVYTQEIAVTGMTADTDGTVYPCIKSTSAAAVVEELKAVSTFFGRGLSESGAGKLVLTCYKKCPKADFGLTFQGALIEE